MYVLVNGFKIHPGEPDIKILNIEEDIQGRDVLTFEYKGKQYKSLVFVTHQNTRR